MNKKIHRDDITIDTIVTGVLIHLDRTSLAQIIDLPDEGNSVTLGSTTRDTPDDIKWSFEVTCDRI